MGRLVSFVCNQSGAKKLAFFFFESKKLALVSAGYAYVVDVIRVIFIEKRQRSIELGAFS